MQCLQSSPLWALGLGGRLTRARQEAADALLETGLDVPSLEAILQAVESVNRTGWGTTGMSGCDRMSEVECADRGWDIMETDYCEVIK